MKPSVTRGDHPKPHDRQQSVPHRPNRRAFRLCFSGVEVEMLEKIRQEWSSIIAAPWSYITIGTACFASGAGLIAILDHHQIESLKSDRDLYKDKIEASEPQIKSGESPTAVSTMAASLRSYVAPSPPNSDRYVSQSVAGKYISLLQSNGTALQIDLLLRPYIGKKMRLSGRLLNTDILNDEIKVQVEVPASYESYFVSFSRKWSAQLSTLSRNSRFQVDVTITQNEKSIIFSDGELV